MLPCRKFQEAATTYKGVTKKNLSSRCWAEISILVINTNPSETNQMRGGQVVREGSYQLFINSTLNSSCGSLKEKVFYVKKCIISLAVNKLLLRNKSEKRRKFFYWSNLPCTVTNNTCGWLLSMEYPSY
jgi:hypothetical protein